MPVTYSFSTVLVIPATQDFNCLDLDDTSMAAIGSIPETSFSRGAPWFTVDLYDDMVLQSDDEIATIFSIGLAISQKFTFETTFAPYDLPLNLNDLNRSRLFIGVFDAQDNAGGVLISKGGLAIVSSFGNTVMPIAGSQNIIEEGTDYYTLRMVVDGQNNVMDLYITPAADVATSGHVLRYTTAAPVTPHGRADSVRIEVVGNIGKHTAIGVDTLRCNCTELIIPNKRPIADTGRDQTAVLGSVVALDGTDSYDPEGEDLSYNWSLYAAPEGSAYRKDGSTGFTLDDGDGDGFTFFLEETGSPWSAANAPDLQPGDILIVGENQYTVSASVADWVWNSSTNKYDRSLGFNSNKLRITADALPDNLSAQNWTLYFVSSFFGDKTAPQPTFVPDIPGLYGVQLVVNDGTLNSLPDQGLINISQSNIPFGYVPDVNFIWDYLSDAWALYDDRDPVTTIWSGFAQVAANLLLTAWQLDYAKSLVDIERLFQRRWLDYRTLYEEPVLDRDDITLRIIRGPLVSSEFASGAATLDFGAGQTLIISRDGGDPVEITLQGVLTAQAIADRINVGLGEQYATTQTAGAETAAGKYYVVLRHEGLLVVAKEGTANSLLGFSTTEDQQNDLRGTGGTAAGLAFSVTDPLISFTNFVQKGDLLTMGGGREVLKVAKSTELSLKNALTATGSWEISSSLTAANTNFSSELIQTGDILILEVREVGSFSSEKLLCRVTGAENKVLGFDPRPLLEKAQGNLDAYEVSLFGVQRVKAIPVDTLVSKIPRLQEVILDPETFFSENRDYTISTNSAGVRGIIFKDGLFSFDNPPPDILWAETTFLDNKGMIENNFGKPVGFLVEHLNERSEDLDYLSAVRGLWYAFFNGPSLWSVRVGIQILLGLPFAEVDGVITDINEAFNARQIRVLVRDSADDAITRSYFIPRNANFEEDGVSMIADNPSTETTYAVGDTIEQFSPLSKGVELLDWVKDSTWWRDYAGQGVFLEIDKFFKFLVRADIDVFSIANLVFAMDFVKKIRPHYTYPMWVVFKRIPGDTISVTDPDNLDMTGTLHLFDHPACAQQIAAAGTGGAYRFDDTDESGVYNWAFDGSPLGGSAKPEFLYDKKELCPEDSIMGIMSSDFAGGVFPYDWMWAFDDGGGTDEIPLSGPLVSQPPSGGPYGTPVGVINFDASYGAGWYTRGKLL